MRIKPPTDITGDALDEWNRIIAAVKQVGHEIKPADASLLATYCRTWTVNQLAYKHIQENGSTVVLANRIVCQSQQYKIFEKTTALLRGLLADLGASPASRKFDQKTAGEVKPPKLEY